MSVISARYSEGIRQGKDAILSFIESRDVKMKSYKNKTVVITGGATGIGFALAKQFAQEGANIVIGALRGKKINDAIKILHDMGSEAAGTICDVTQYEQVEALADFAQDTFGKADVLVNNAGIGNPPKSILETDISEIDHIMDVNYKGVLFGSQIFAKRFINQDGPTAIYNLGSENSLFSAVPKAYAYIASKHAVLALTEQMAEEFAGRIEVKLICPGLVASELTAGIPGSMPADEFAKTAMVQLKAEGIFFVVSHAFNLVRIEERYDEIRQAYSQYAPRYDGDETMDVRTLLAKLAKR